MVWWAEYTWWYPSHNNLRITRYFVLSISENIESEMKRLGSKKKSTPPENRTCCVSLALLRVFGGMHGETAVQYRT